MHSNPESIPNPYRTLTHTYALTFCGRNRSRPDPTERAFRSRILTVCLHIHFLYVGFCGRHRSRSDCTKRAFRSRIFTVCSHMHFHTWTFVEGIDQDQTAQNVHSDPESLPSACMYIVTHSPSDPESIPYA